MAKLKKPTAAEGASRKESDRCALCRAPLVWVVRDGKSIPFDLEGQDHRTVCSHQRCWAKLRQWAKDPRFFRVILADDETVLDVMARDDTIMAALKARGK